ncbi:oxysterol-binding protein-related protein 8 isoform X4 [Rhipicephalus microplus]|uniref:oxysterol-binding protein-related protein 8 isoform X4 n=1 Tax=Rhipicephalus microplus TaxID=6941 RepID=UPI003F6BD6D7
MKRGSSEQKIAKRPTSIIGGGGSLSSRGPEASGEEPRLSDTQSTTSLSPKQSNCDFSKGDVMAGDSTQMSAKLAKRESYKAQRKHYRFEKKRVAMELSSTLTDPSIIVLADWLKVRGSLKGWTKLWCVLKPGLLLLYKSPKIAKSSQWVGTVLLNACELIERPSKKDGFCFKIFHPLEQSIWASRGPRNEAIGALVQPLPVSHLIFRAPSEAAGKCWMDALELSLRCSSLLLRSMTSGHLRSNSGGGTGLGNSRDSTLSVAGIGASEAELSHIATSPTTTTSQQRHWNESDLENHFKDQDLGDDAPTDDQRDGTQSLRSSDTDSEEEEHQRLTEDSGEAEQVEVEPETPYQEESNEELGVAGDAGQTEEVAEENRSLIWALVKQVRPGMDLSKVVLPTFILEPRSFLDKLADYYYHADILSRAVQEDDPLTRMKLVVQWYLSGFYKKPKGLKKPYNPILGEVFRCCWKHPETGSRTFYIAEQVSHHPPISSFYVSNRPDGFCISGTILAKSKFYGNSLSAILEGTAQLSFLTRGETYTITMPYAHCKGILMGTLTMELGGKVNIVSEKTGYRTELEFKLKPFLGGSELCNLVTGKLKLGKETLFLIQGHWDGQIFLRDKRTQEEQVLWHPTQEVRSKRLKRSTVPLELQQEYESERLWQHVSAAIVRGDQVAATEEKTILEEAQRRSAKERQARMEPWMPRFFIQDLLTGDYIYKHADSRPWDPRNDVVQFERNGVIQSKTRHQTPIVPSGGSLVSIEGSPPESQVGLRRRILHSSPRQAAAHLSHRHHHHHHHHHRQQQQQSGLANSVGTKKERKKKVGPAVGIHHSGSSSAERGPCLSCDSTDSEALAAEASKGVAARLGLQPSRSVLSSNSLSHSLGPALAPLQRSLEEANTTLNTLQRHLEHVVLQQRQLEHRLSQRSDITTVAFMLVFAQVAIHLCLWAWFPS